MRYSELLDWLTRRSPRTLFVGALLTVVLIGAVDYLTGYQWSSSIFYLVPILIGSWTLGPRGGAAISLFSAMVWLAADLAGHHRYSHPMQPYWNVAVRLGIFMLCVWLLTELKNQLLRARHDPLTGMANRLGFYETANIELERCRRYGHPLTLMYIDCDDFKAINDRHGHHEGDAVLRRVAQVLHANVREMDTVGRMGGDEFVVLFPETGTDFAGTVYQKLRRALEESMAHHHSFMTFSAGMATFLVMPKSVADLIKSADELMYSAKKNGKNRVCQEVIKS